MLLIEFKICNFFKSIFLWRLFIFNIAICTKFYFFNRCSLIKNFKFAENRSMDLSVLSVGDVSFVFAPYEMFASNGAAIRETSPYPMTFIITCSYDHAGYLPDVRGVEINCYEAQITKFEYGTAEKLVTEYVDMLTELKGQ